MANITVIGIDPGSQRTGWGVVAEESGTLRLVECGIIHTTAENATFPERLAKIYHELVDVLTRLAPEEAAIEQVFVAKNSASALKLGQARGVAIAACAAKHLLVTDYAPTEVKKAMVGTGRAEKEQVAFMVQTMLNMHNKKWPLDTTDALGLALCHLTTRAFRQRAKLT